MKIEVSNIFVGIVLFATGFVAGNLLNFPLNNIYSISNILSLLGILVTATIGISALRTWKHQFQYTENYKAAINLELSANEYLQKYDDYRYAYFKAAKSGLKKSDMDKISEFDVFMLSYKKYKDTWEFILPFLSQKEIIAASISPDKLQRQLISLLSSINDIHQDKYDPSKDLFDERINALKGDVIADIRRFRNMASL